MGIIVFILSMLLLALEMGNLLFQYCLIMVFVFMPFVAMYVLSTFGAMIFPFSIAMLIGIESFFYLSLMVWKKETFTPAYKLILSLRPLKIIGDRLIMPLINKITE
jgi:hypothetical protein